jgi:hypothetical protein
MQMARPLPLEYVDTIYNVTSRGGRRAPDCDKIVQENFKFLTRTVLVDSLSWGVHRE